ncbi:MAG TPA: hypothetical protein VKV17_21350 [Bryobacteraceae bacterium]|nr:hypothetical protein [Bryobacteraceae bacterium]
MRSLSLGFVLIFGTAGFAQNRGFVNPTPVFQGTFGNVVFPAGTAAIPGVHRFFGNAVFPAGNPPQLYVPFSVTDPTAVAARFGRSVGFPHSRPAYSSGGFAFGVPYAVPVYVGGYAGYTGYYDSGVPADTAAGAPPAQPNVIVVYPSGMPPSALSGGYGEAYAPPVAPASSPAPAVSPSDNRQDQAAASNPSSPTYLVALKDHTIYSAVAYWVEGDTLHYFTSGSTHNQVSLSLVDRELTQRLNAEAGNNMQLPAN